ncbi:Bacterial regulatory proteins, ArsR family protein (fragment) [Mesorhizobium metallidurans STM 2683]|uniref:Bacterial regulatory proteins, ArsR family protein n=2 Tax=Mesorhizobium metallidurans TaxID=489722 RepID=M5F3G2_9HYPH
MAETLSIDDYAKIFAALSEPMRLRMIQMIDDTDEMACTKLVETLGLAKATISYHVKILSQANLIRVRKQGRNYFYKARRDVLDNALKGVRQNLQKQRVAKNPPTGEVRAA